LDRQIEREQKNADLEKTYVEIDRSVLEQRKLEAETQKIIEETRGLRRWPLVFMVTALTAIAALAGVAVQFLNYRKAVTEREFKLEQARIENDSTGLKLERQQLEFFKQQNPEMTKLYVKVGELQAQLQAAEDRINKKKGPAPSPPNPTSTSPRK
jgi:hypothetical protein